MGWIKNTTIGMTAPYRSCRIDRTTLNSGGHLYYVFWSENVQWAAPHSKMSEPMRSLKAAKRKIDHLLERESKDISLIVERAEYTSAKALWTERRAL